MKVEKIGDTLAVRIPQDVATALGLHEGDGVAIQRLSEPKRLSDAELENLWDSMDELVRPLPPGYKFDREEANAR